MAALANLSFYQGEDVTLTVTMTPATNITGWTLQFTVRRQYGDDVLLSKVLGSGIAISDAANGVFTVSLTSADTLRLAPRNYVYDIQRTNAGQRAVLTIGTIALLPQVSL